MFSPTHITAVPPWTFFFYCWKGADLMQTFRLKMPEKFETLISSENSLFTFFHCHIVFLLYWLSLRQLQIYAKLGHFTFTSSLLAISFATRTIYLDCSIQIIQFILIVIRCIQQLLKVWFSCCMMQLMMRWWVSLSRPSCWNLILLLCDGRLMSCFTACTSMSTSLTALIFWLSGLWLCGGNHCP